MAIFNKRVPTFFYELLNKPLEEVKKILGIGQQTFTDTNITEGTLNTATTNRTVDLDTFDLSIEGSGDRKIYQSNLVSEINHLIVNRVGSTVSPTFHNRLETTPNLIKLDSRNGGSFGEISINNTNLNVTLYSSLGNYRIGINNSTIPPIFPSTTSPHVLSLNPNNGVMYTTDTSSYFISDSALAPASAGSPTFTEVETYIAGLGASVTPTLKNRVLYYTGTNTSTDAYTHSYFYSGNGKLYELGGSSINNITEGTLNVAATDRTVDLGGNTLEIIGTNNKTIKNTTGTVETKLLVTDFSATISQTDTGVSRYVSATTNGIYLDNNSSSSFSLYNNGDVSLFGFTGVYQIGQGAIGRPLMFSDPTTTPLALSIDSFGYLKHTSTEAVFISDTALNPSIGGHPTVTEVRTYLVSLAGGVQGNYKNRYIYYTGTDTATDTPRYTYFFTGNKQLFLVNEPMQKMYSLPVTKGGQVLTSANNGITGDVVSIVDFWDIEYTRLNFKFSWDATPSTGACDIIVRADFNNAIVYQTTIADMSQAGGHFGRHIGNNIGASNAFSSYKGFYIELTNITGDVHNFAGSFVIKEGK